MRDPRLTSTDKIVATALLLKFRNKETGQCNPSYRTVANAIGMSRDAVMDAVKRLNAAGYVAVNGTKGGSVRHTNQFDFPLPSTGGGYATGEEHATGGTDVDKSRGADTSGVEQPPHELSIEPSRTNSGDQVEADGLDRSLPRPIAGALRDPLERERTEVVQNRIAMRLGSDGWNFLFCLSESDLDRITELERQAALTDEVLAAIKLKGSLKG
ncbi:helix-turn-helix domain-containing protein [Bradyrhizobium sp. UFLA05-109]